MTYKNEVLNEREKTHGNFSDTAHIAQGLKEVLRRCPEFDKLDSAQRESLEMICTKMARILSGNPDEPDHWKDGAGYFNLVSERLQK
jgi:hypothetical protein